MPQAKKFVPPFCASIAVFFILSSLGSARAASYYVSTAGLDSNPGTEPQPFRSIAKGLSILGAGDRLYLRSGTYAEQINSNIQTIPTGSSWVDAPIISSYPGETAILRPSAGSEAINLSHPYIQYLIFSSFIVDGSDLLHSCPGGYGCSVGVSATNGANHVRFNSVEIRNTGGQGVLMTPGSSSAPTAFEFIGCDIHHHGTEARDHGLYISTSGNLIKNSKVHHNAGHGIHIYTGSAVIANNNTIDGNEIYDNATLSGSAPGILLDFGSDNKAINNIVRGNKNGIHVGNPFSPGTTASGAKVYNNTIYSNNPGVGINVFASSSAADVKNNIVYKNGGTIINTGSGTTSLNNLTTDPIFSNETNGNFMLQQSSPAVDQGIILSEVAYDIVGVTRPQLSGYDIGAFEYTSPADDTVPPAAPTIIKIQ